MVYEILVFLKHDTARSLSNKPPAARFQSAHQERPTSRLRPKSWWVLYTPFLLFIVLSTHYFLFTTLKTVFEIHVILKHETARFLSHQPPARLRPKFWWVLRGPFFNFLIIHPWEYITLFASLIVFQYLPNPIHKTAIPLLLFFTLKFKNSCIFVVKYADFRLKHEFVKK